MSTAIGESKRRLPWWGRILAAAAVFGALGACGIYVLGLAASARWERYAAELRAAGEPLTFEEIEALRTKIPDELNGARVLERLAPELLEVDRHVDDLVFVFGSGDYPDFFAGVPRYAIEPSKRFLADNADLLQKLSVFEKAVTGRFDIVAGGDPADALIPTLRTLRAAARLEYLNAAMRLVDSDTSGAAQAARLHFHISAALDEDPTLIARLNQMGTDSLAIKAVESILRVGELDNRALGGLSATIDARLAPTTLRWAILGGRCNQVSSGELSVSAMQATKECSARWGRGQWASPEDLRRRTFDWIPDMIVYGSKIRGVELLTELLRACDDGPKLLAAAKQIDAEVAKLPRSQAIVRVLMSTWERATAVHLRSLGELRAAHAALAAERFRLKAGRLPTSLDELTPEFLETIPLDPFDGQPMRLAETEKGIVIYSIAENLIDDGGALAWRKAKPHRLDVGFRLFKPEHRGLLLTDEPPPNDD